MFLKKIALFGFAILLYASCSSCASTSVNKILTTGHPAENYIPLSSFVQILQKVIVIECDTPMDNVTKTNDNDSPNQDKDNKVPNCHLDILNIAGSGGVIKEAPNGSYVFTAEHVCMPKEIKEIEKVRDMGVANVKVQKFIIIKNIDEKTFSASIYTKDETNDVCVLFVPNLHQPAIKLANAEPQRGERLYNMAAPASIFAKNMIPIFDGFYLGTFEGAENRFQAAYSIYAKGGSSGSVVVNFKGELVGMLHSISSRVINVSFGPSYQVIKGFLFPIIYDQENKEKDILKK